MNNLFFPTAHNNFKAYLMKTPVLLIAILLISSFNFILKVDATVQTDANSLTIVNLLETHNTQREEANLSELRLSAKLNSSALNKAQEMLKSNCWSHYCPDGKSPWDFFDNAGYEYALAGENLAEGYYYLDDLMNAWINSKTHRDNILNPDYTDIGFGIVKGTYQGIQNNIIVVAHFGTPTDNLISTNSSELTITHPENGAVLNSDNINIEGIVSGFEEVSIILNGNSDGIADIQNGIFTYKVESLELGDNYIYAQSKLNSGSSKDSNVVKVIYDETSNLQEVSNGIVTQIDTNLPIKNDSGFITTPEFKNILNLFFIIGLAVLFLIDFIVLSRSNMLSKERSFTHYHFGLFIVLAIIILTGGFGGNLTQAINI